MAATMVSSSTEAAAIVNGTPAKAYSFVGSLQLTDGGDPNWHSCGLTLINPWWVETNAHCVTNMPATTTSGAATAAFRNSYSASASAEGIDRSDPSIYHIRLGSADRLAGGEVRHVTEIVVHPSWNWGVPDEDGYINDIAMMRLDQPVFTLAPALVAPARESREAREVGWGYTVTDPSTVAGQPAPRRLSQINVPVQPASACAASGIGAGELCLAGGDGGSCNGDSGTAALQQFAGEWRIAIGSASRGPDTTCGEPGKPGVYTDLSAYRDWMIRTVFGLPEGASTAGRALDTAAAPAA
ncbi:serine protease [Amycolatopsis acidicola]